MEMTMNKTTKTILKAIQKSNGCCNSATLTYSTPLKFATIKRHCAKLVEQGLIVNEPSCDGNVCYYITTAGALVLGLYS